MWDAGRARDRFARLGRVLFGLHGSDEAAGDGFLARFNDWLDANGLYQSAPSVGVTREVYGQVADYAVRIYGDGTQIPALGPVMRDDMVTILTMTERQTPRA